ncbi:hypothetical protein BgAZ_203220 [Babesia gibsoni]|uniref:Uncharacterized protein n=1 Tax=Babesia gibsoni TaxID=33632 RepID=A0AAD8PE75_BABGI|nr:hypothetical protein BgAZ_203220 [Babesia gibsoni]
MGDSRKDQVYVLSNFFVLVLIGFTCFMSSDFIRLLTFDTVGDEAYWIFVYHLVFWMSTMSVMLVRTPAAACLMYCIRLNIIFMIGACISYIMKWFESISLHILLCLWAYISSSAMVNAVAFASYHTSGSRGLSLGCMLSFCSTYIVLEIIKYIVWTHEDLGNYRNLVVGYVIFRIMLSFVTMAMLSMSAGTLHFADFDRAFACLKKGVLMEWISGTIYSTEVQVALSEVVPTYVSPLQGVMRIMKDAKLAIIWILFIILTFTSSVFTPYVCVANWDLSIFKIGELERAEHIGNFAGTIIATLWGKNWCNIIFLSIVYLIHLTLSLFLSGYVHSYRVSLAIPMEPIVAVTCITAIMGSYLTVVTFSRFFDICMDFSCVKNTRNCRIEEICCQDDESSECLCSEQFCGESCGPCPSSTSSVAEKTKQIFVPGNHKEMYKLWLPDYCLYCWLYRHNPLEVCSLSKNKSTSSSNGNGNEAYILRNSKVSICPYCDLNLLLECESLKCTCTDVCNIPFPNGNKVEGDEEEKKEEKEEEKEKEEKKNEEDTDDKPIKLPLHEIELPCQSKISLVTTASTSFVIQDSSCCTCGSAAAKKGKDEDDDACKGRTFTVSAVKVYSCCHYSMKVMLSCKEPNSKFSWMQKPYAGKYNPVGSIVFNGIGNSSSGSGSGSGGSGGGGGKGGSGCSTNQTNGQTNGNGNGKSTVKENCDSLKHALQKSTLKSLTKLARVEDPNGENGLCICCMRAAKVQQGGAQNGSGTTGSPTPATAYSCPTSSTTTTTATPTTTPTTSPSSSSSEPSCCHIKVQPTALPYSFRRKDIYRRNYVGAMFFGLIFFGFAKLLAAGIFALREIRIGLDLSSNFNLVKPFFKESNDPAVYGIDAGDTDEVLLARFNKEWKEALNKPDLKESEMSSEVTDALSKGTNEPLKSQNSEQNTGEAVNKDGEATSATASPSPATPEPQTEVGTDEAATKEPSSEHQEEHIDETNEAKEEQTLLTYEQEMMEDVMKDYRWLFNDLEYAFLENWADVYISKRKRDADVEKIKRIRRIKWCLEAGLKDYCLSSATSIMAYLERNEGKWDAEWEHYEYRVKRKFKAIGKSLARLSPESTERLAEEYWQPAVNKVKVSLLNNANDVANGMSTLITRLDELKKNFEGATGTQRIVELLKMWDFRVEILEGLTRDGDLFLRWRRFMERWDQIKGWKDLFLPMYLKEYKNVGVSTLE